MSRLLLSTLFACATLVSVSALSLGSTAELLPTVPPQQRVALISGERITHFYDDPAEISLIPITVHADRIRQSLVELSPRIGVEALYLLPLPPELLQQPDFALRLNNILRSVSTMEGIEYYSASREQMRTFYRESYVIDDPRSRQRIADPVVNEVPHFDRVFAFQHDSSFGRNTYALDYRYQSGQLGLTMVNLTRMSYGILPLVGQENLEIHLSVVPADEGLLFYGNCGVRLIGLFGMQDRVQSSFSNRIDAIYRWFSGRVRQEFEL